MPAPVLQVKRGALSNLPGLKAGEPAFTTDSFDFYVGIDSTTNNNKFVGSHRYWSKETASKGSGVNLVEATGGSDFITLAAPASVGAAITYTFPGTITDGYFLKTNSSGVLSWGEVVSQFNIAADSGSPDTVSTGSTITFAGGTNVNTAVTDNTITVNLDNNISVSGLSTFTQGLIADSVRVGVVTDTIDTTAGKLTLNSATGTVEVTNHLDVLGDLDVTGNVYIGGTTVTLRGTDVFIENKDIVLGYTTSVTPNDTTANHAGVAIASTVGSSLVSFVASGINTLPDTYKQLMWFKSGTLGFSTDAFAFNYGLAIGTTTMADGVRLAVGTGVTVSDTTVTATTFYGALSGNASSADQVKTITASDTAANYYVTFVDSHNGSATNETVYTDDGIYYNPGTNTFTTQYGYFTGNVTVDGTITGTASTATRATTVDTTGTSSNADYYVTFVDTLAGETGETLRVGAGLSVNPSTGEVKTKGRLSVGDPGALTSYIKAGGGSDAMYLYANGDVAFQQKVIVGGLRSSSNSNNTLILTDLDASFARDLSITGITTTGTFKLNGTSGIGITGISTSTTLAENSNNYLPTQAAVKAYVDAIDFDDDLGLAGDSGTGTVNLDSESLQIYGTANEVVTVAAGTSITVGLPDSVTVTTALTTPTVNATNLKANDGTTAITITNSTGAVGFANSVTISGDLYVLGTATEVNTDTLKVQDPLIDLGLIDNGSGQLIPPTSDLNLDIGILLNWYSGSAKKASVYWDDSARRVGIASDVTESSGVLTANAYAAVEIGALWVTDCAGTSQVISCTGAERFLENITVDAGTF